MKAFAFSQERLPTTDATTKVVAKSRVMAANGLIMREFMAAFRQLSRDSRQALILSALKVQSYGQIARHAGVSMGTVKSHLARSRDARAAARGRTRWR